MCIRDRTGSDAGRPVTSRRVPLAVAPSGTRLLVALLVACAACDTDPTSGTPVGTRTYRMGFSAIPPTTNQATALASLDMWSTRADAAIMHVDVQWAAMLAGMSAAEAARANAFDLANYYRAHNPVSYTHLRAHETPEH